MVEIRPLAAIVATIATVVVSPPATTAGASLKVLIVDGQSNHEWQKTTPLLEKALDQTGIFAVDVATSPPKGSDMSGFGPNFSAYDVMVSNYTDVFDGDSWSSATQTVFEDYVRRGGGFVSVHAADNAFPQWQAYNEMIGIGGWGGRDENWGPYVRFRDGRVILDHSSGRGGSHGKRHAYQLVARNTDHPITKGLPRKWMHAEDELYDRLRGPAKDITVLATAYSDPATGGTGEHEPMLLTITYGEGRIFHTTLGHDALAMSCVGFITTLQRGAEWAASGKVRQKNPPDFPTADRVRVRE